MSELDRALLALGRSIDVPDAPDVSVRVRQRLEQGPSPGSAWLHRRVLVVAAAAVIVVAGALMAVPQSRTAILDWLGVGAVTIRYVEELPAAGKATDDLGLGEEVTLAEARRRAGFRVRLPRAYGLDEPPRVYYRSDVRQVGFLYGSQDDPKLLITQAATVGAVEKLLTAETEVELVGVGDGRGVWLSGRKHALFYPAAGDEEPFRLVGNALVFETLDGVTIRIEAEISKSEALRIAASMR